MYRKLTVVTIIVLLLSLAFASVSFAQSGTDNQGTGPNNAFMSAGQGRSLAPGQRQWYSFQSTGDEDNQVQIRLAGQGVQFSVWSQQDIANAAGDFGNDATPKGRSTGNEDMGNDQFWSGSFNTPGTYYIMVERTNGGQGDNANASGNYSLQVTGAGVSFGGLSSNNQSNSNNQSGSDQSSAAASAAPVTLPVTGGGTASVLPMLLGGLGALSVAAGALLRRKK
jgi:LPXTG-motif cell wall-anchored protein